MPPDCATTLAREVLAKIRQHEGECVQIVMAEFREGFTALSGPEQVKYAYRWHRMYQQIANWEYGS